LMSKWMISKASRVAERLTRKIHERRDGLHYSAQRLHRTDGDDDWPREPDSPRLHDQGNPSALGASRWPSVAAGALPLRSSEAGISVPGCVPPHPDSGSIATVNRNSWQLLILRRHDVIHVLIVWLACDTTRRHTPSYLLEGMYADYRSRRR
jgi:hypothetical protein